MAHGGERLQSGPRPLRTHQSVQGYLANAGALFGIATPVWETTARAATGISRLPERSAENRLEGYLDFRSDYHTPLSHAAMSGTVDRRDDFNADSHRRISMRSTRFNRPIRRPASGDR